MGMVVRTNTMANNAFRQLGMNNSAVSKSLEKLSSGFRINRAGDDAAGLAISERMKAQIKGLDAASANAQDGISLVQTAEGALNEVHDMLNRMVELATKAANGVYTDSQRQNYADEVSQLKSEINRIADSTNFNSLNLLDGTMSGNGASGTPIDMTASGDTREFGGVTGIEFAADLDENIRKAFNEALAKSTTTDSFDMTVTNNEVTFALSGALSAYSVVVELDGNYTTPGGAVSTASIGEVWITDKAGNKIAKINSGFTASGSAEFIAPGESFIPDTTGKANFTLDLSSLNSALTTTDSNVTINIGGVEVATSKQYKDDAKDVDILKDLATEINKQNGNTGVKIGDATYQAYLNAEGDGLVFIATETGKQDNFANTIAISVDGGADNGITVAAQGVNGTDVQDDVTLQVGDTNAAYNQLKLNIGNMHTDFLGSDKGKVEDIDITTQDSAGAAIDVINGAIDQVSKERSNLGAIQNRLEHTINNLDTTSENLSAANSRIRDTDMAKEMMNYTKMNVLVQSAQAMLAQANQQPQSVLQLLQ